MESQSRMLLMRDITHLPYEGIVIEQQEYINAPSAYGISYNDIPNKPISYFIIKGYNDDKSDIITTPSGGNDFFVDD